MLSVYKGGSFKFTKPLMHAENKHSSASQAHIKNLNVIEISENNINSLSKSLLFTPAQR